MATQEKLFEPVVREFNKFDEEKIIKYDLDLLSPNEELLRGKIDPDTLKSIKMNGQWQPILLCTLDDGRVMIIDGEQRVKIQRKLGNTWIAAIMYPEVLDEFNANALRSHMNNARQENPVADIENIRRVLDVWPNMSVKAIALTLGMKQGRVRSLVKQARMPKVFIEAVSNGTMSKDTLSDLSRKPLSVQKKAEVKYRDAREQVSVTKNDETGEMEYKRLSDGFVYAKPPILLTSGDVKDFQRISVENMVQQAPINLSVEIKQSVTGFAAVKDGKFITDLFDTADEVRLELGRKKGVVVRVVSI